MTRHWIITDGTGHVEEVNGPGVVGKQPVLAPGESFTYTSGCPLNTPFGVMEGTYQMVTASGEEFDAKIAPFTLSEPYTVSLTRRSSLGPAVPYDECSPSRRFEASSSMPQVAAARDLRPRRTARGAPSPTACRAAL